jgi:hypothetical protein
MRSSFLPLADEDSIPLAARLRGQSIARRPNLNCSASAGQLPAPGNYSQCGWQPAVYRSGVANL